jgi:hypothetical protein
LSSDEAMALSRCFEIFAGQYIYFVCGKSFDLNHYNQCLENKTFLIKRFDDRYFTSIDGYSILLLSLHFYRAFKKYDYVLLYQLDAWVFRNELEYWCNKGFSYIGAPWLSGWFFADEHSYFIGVGNGGFSLRKIKDHINVLKKFRYFILPFRYLKSFLQHPSFRSLKSLVKNIAYRNNPFYFYYNYPYDYPVHEDVFWGRIASRVFKNFTVPGPDVAIHFAVEVVPSKYVNDSDLPFGCHAWNRQDPGFWKRYILGL